MAKYKPVKSKKGKPSNLRGLIPCGLLILGGFAIIFLLFYLVLRSGQ